MKHDFLVDPRGNLQHVIDGEVRATVPSTHAEQYHERAQAEYGRRFELQKVDTLISVAYPPEAERALLAGKVAELAAKVAEQGALIGQLNAANAAKVAPTSTAKT